LQLDPTAPPGPDGPAGWVAVRVDAGADAVLAGSGLDTDVEVWLLEELAPCAGREAELHVLCEVAAWPLDGRFARFVVGLPGR
jgi:hypothetical protein